MIADKVFNLPSFQRQYRALLIIAVNDAFENIIWIRPRTELLAEIDWSNLITLANILSYSDKTEHLDAALRIAQTCVSLPMEHEYFKDAAAFILENLSNKQAIKLAISRQLLQPDFKKHLPASLQLQINKENISNSIVVNDQVINLNRFQKDVYRSHEQNQSVSISAPTSSGKSFILYHLILEEINNDSKNIVYLVPTRALISQVEEDLRAILPVYAIRDVNVSTVPTDPPAESKKNIFVFTQERLHWFMLNHLVVFDVVIIDEAHKIDDGNRGILLQQKLEELVAINPGVKMFFSSPFTANPELLLDTAAQNGKKGVVNTNLVVVNQNLIYISEVPRSVKEWNLKLIVKDIQLDLGTILLSSRTAFTEFKKVAFLATGLSHGQTGNILYANGAAESEKLGLILFDHIGPSTISTNVEELIKLVKKTIHRDYSLAKVLKRKIAFHYGNMPLLIRHEIEKLFKTGEIEYLICTSTLLEGVNLPAKSIFIRKPRRGTRHPLNENDFWNLAGRAGRLGKEMSGNIFCIEPAKWEIPPDPYKSRQVIKRALDELELNNADKFIAFIEEDAPRKMAESNQEFEFAYGYYYGKYLQQKLNADNLFHRQLIKTFDIIRSRITVPENIIRRNPGIAPVAQQALMDYFLSQQDLESLLPLYPEDTNAYDNYVYLLEIISQTISFYPTELLRSRAVLLINWMKGKPLSFLIQASYDSYQKNPRFKGSKTIPIVIRETMQLVENFVRFRFAKDSTCYVDLLRYVYQVNKRIDLVERIPDLTMWLEFGVNMKTHLSLLALGLSRNTVIELASFISNAEMTKEQALEWLRNSDYEKLELSAIIKEDIRRSLIV